jgi:hypothetical protein
MPVMTPSELVWVTWLVWGAGSTEEEDCMVVRCYFSHARWDERQTYVLSKDNSREGRGDEDGGTHFEDVLGLKGKM